MSSMSNPSGNRDGGEKGEAATASLISDVLGGDLIYQHAPGESPQGIDLSYLDDGELHVAEVKSIIGDWHQPSTASTVDGRQMDSHWVADRLGRIGVEVEPEDVGTETSQVQTDLFQVDFSGDTIARFEIGDDGRRSENAPSEVYSLSDVLNIHDAANVPEAEPVGEEAGQSENESDAGESAS